MTKKLNEDLDSRVPLEPTLDLEELRNINVSTKVLHNREIDIDELKKESSEVQIAAICQWFLDNYLPYDDSFIIDDDEEGPIWLLHGPYDAKNEILSTFGSQIHPKVIHRAIEAIESTEATEWCSKPYSDPFEDDYSFEWITSTFDPMKNLSSHIEFVQHEIKRGDPRLNKLLFSSLISALEAFIWQNMRTLACNKIIAKKIIEINYKTIRIDDLYKHSELKIEEFLTKKAWEILGFTVFHKTREINSMFKALGINASISDLKEEIEKRHDIVHRSGFSRNNKPTTITDDDLRSLISKIQAFSNNFSNEMKGF